MTYESASEAEVFKTLWRPGAPLENTVFAILDPNGHAIVRGGRSPHMVFRDSSEMASQMNEIARYYNSGGAFSPRELPAVDTVRLAVDVAACDKRPLVIVTGQNEAERKNLAARLAPVAWSQQLVGKLVYTTGSPYDLSSIKNANKNSGYIFVAPGVFGTDGTAIVQLGANATAADLSSASKQALSMYRPQVLDHHNHVRLGHQQGIEWQTAIPVTDPHTPHNQHGAQLRGPGQFGGPPEGGRFGGSPGSGGHWGGASGTYRQQWRQGGAYSTSPGASNQQYVRQY